MKITLTISNKIKFGSMPMALINAVKKELTMVNPKYIENEKYGYSNFKTPSYLEFFWQKSGKGFYVPKGYLPKAIEQCKRHGLEPVINDELRSFNDVSFNFVGELRDYQAEAVSDMLTQPFGTLCAPTGSGKTCMALYLVAERKQPAIVIVHTNELLNQWISRIESFLGIPKKEIGVIGNRKYKIGKKITVAMIQTLCKRYEEIEPLIGHIIVDECHRTPSKTFLKVLTNFSARYVLGLSATPYRRDGLTRLIYLFVGAIIHNVGMKRLNNSGQIVKPEIIFRKTNYNTKIEPSIYYSKMMTELTNDPIRNHQIASDVVEESKASGVCLVLSDRKKHCDALEQAIFKLSGIKPEVLTGATGSKERKNIVEKLNNYDVKILIATGQLIGEGFDCKDLSTLFLATPIKFRGRLLQYIGRVLRPAPGKDRAKIYDYIDVNVGLLAHSARKRREFYDNVYS